MAFHTAGIYLSPATAREPEDFYFRQYPWGQLTTVATYVGREANAQGGHPGRAAWGVSNYTAELVCTAHQHNVRAVGHVDNIGEKSWPQLRNASWRREWVGQVVDWFITRHGMDGIQLV